MVTSHGVSPKFLSLAYPVQRSQLHRVSGHKALGFSSDLQPGFLFAMGQTTPELNQRKDWMMLTCLHNLGSLAELECWQGRVVAGGKQGSVGLAKTSSPKQFWLLERFPKAHYSLKFQEGGTSHFPGIPSQLSMTPYNSYTGQFQEKGFCIQGRGRGTKSPHGTEEDSCQAETSCGTHGSARSQAQLPGVAPQRWELDLLHVLVKPQQHAAPHPHLVTVAYNVHTDPTHPLWCRGLELWTHLHTHTDR